MRKKWLSTMLAVVMLTVLLLPNAASAAPSKGNIIHVVQRGEMLSTIARRYGINMWTLARANGITNPNRIYVGQRLVIPTYQATGHVHVVQRGETLTHIALRYGVNVWTIARANGITNLNFVYVGQRLVIPGAPAPPQPPAPKKTAALPSWYPGPWTGEYFGNAQVGGSPYATRTDPAINFNWDDGPPAGGMPSNHFSVRWTGSFHFEGGTYRFYAKVDDGVRVYVDGHRIIDGWRDGGLRLYSGDKALYGGHHTVQVEYYDSVQVARIYVWWKRISAAEPAAPPPTDMWYGEFFNGENLQGSPVATHHEPAIGFEWGADSPMPGVWADQFSARWTRRVHLNTDHYRFCAMSDDGVRIWVNNQLVLDEWHLNNSVAYCGTYWAETGVYDVRVEYYEHGGKALLYVWWEPH
jgi:LysM repeat protein